MTASLCRVYQRMQLRLDGQFCAVHAVANMLRSVRLTYISVFCHAVGLWNPTHKKFVKMSGSNKLTVSPSRSDGSLPSGWGSERFFPIAVGEDIALWNPTLKRFIRIQLGWQTQQRTLKHVFLGETPVRIFEVRSLPLYSHRRHALVELHGPIWS